MPCSLGPPWGLVYGKAFGGPADTSTHQMPMGTSKGLGSRVTAQTSVGVTYVWRCLCPLANEALRWGWGQQGLYHYSPVGSFTPQIFIEYLLCTRPCTGSKEQVRHDSCSHEACSWHRRNRSPGIEGHEVPHSRLSLPYCTPQEVPQLFLPTSLAH